MATGWAHEGAVQEQIDRTVQDGIQRARQQLDAQSPSATHCDECGEPIPARRRDAVPGVRLCVACQSQADNEAAAAAIVNRRASKDSQLR